MTKVEIGILMDKTYKYYEKIVKKNCKVIFEQEIESWDEYYAKDALDNLTENEMKNVCIRKRSVKSCWKDEIIYQLQNMKLVEKDDLKGTKENIENEILNLKKLGYNKVDSLNSHKIDYQLHLENKKGYLQFQLVDNIGLILYYFNPDYYELDEKTQRRKLIDELNSFGLNVSYGGMDVDKLRTLYYGKLMYSKNQNS